MALTDIDTLKGWARPSMDSTRDVDLARCIDAADAWIKRITGWDIEQETDTVVYLDGSDAIGPSRNILLLDPRYRPVTACAITEDLSSLSVATSYDGASDVYLVGYNEPRQCELVKPSGSWSSGYANIAATITAGYSTIPEDIVQLATEVALLVFRSANWIGKATASTKGGSLTYQQDLTPPSAALLTRLIEKQL